MNHLDETTALIYLDGELETSRSNGIAEHAATCADCRNLLRALENETQWLRHSLTGEEEALPMVRRVVPVRVSSHWAAFAALSFTGLGAATFWIGFADPWLERAAQAGFSGGSVLTAILFTAAFGEGWNLMPLSIEFVAVVALLISLLWLLRGRRRKFSMSLAAAAAFLCLFAFSSAGRAAELGQGHPNYALPAGEEIHTDLIVTGQNTQIDGEVDGDLIVFSRAISVNGHVRGDIIAFGQDILIDGPVDGNVRAFGQSIALNSTVAKNVMAWARSVNMGSKARVGGTMTLGSNNADLAGQISGQVLALSTVLELDGTLANGARVRGSSLIIGPNASVAGQIEYRGPRPADVSPMAKLSSPIRMAAYRRPRPRYLSPAYYWRQILFWGASVLFGFVLFEVAPKWFNETKRMSGNAGLSLGFGLLFFFAIPIAAILSCITIVGLGLGLTLLVLYSIALYAANIFIGAWLGDRLLGPGDAAGGAVIARVALGLAILRILRFVPILGGIIGFVVLLWGLGAIVLTLYQRMRPELPTTA